MPYLTSHSKCPKLYYEFHPASSPPILPRAQVDPFTSLSYPDDDPRSRSPVPRHLIDNGKETILFIHVLTSDSTTFRGQILDPLLRERYNLVVYGTSSGQLSVSKEIPTVEVIGDLNCSLLYPL